jgi:hypothetical protein
LFVGKRVSTGAWVGEFGWELFCWHAQLRHMQKEQDLDMVCTTRPGHQLLYKDFAEVKYFEPASCADRHKWVSREPPESDYPVRDASRMPAEFIRYGQYSKDREYDFLIHARQRKVNRAGDNWSSTNWVKFVETFEFLRIATIGTFSQAMPIAGADDLRGIPLDDLSNYLASSKFIVGGSSGAMHFATLCGCPQVVWSGVPRTIMRYEHRWNPFEVKVSTIAENHPSVNRVISAVECLI